jgi:hypothetical protein
MVLVEVSAPSVDFILGPWFLVSAESLLFGAIKKFGVLHAENSEDTRGQPRGNSLTGDAFRP